jgi:cysteine-rich repeat protein
MRSLFSASIVLTLFFALDHSAAASTTIAGGNIVNQTWTPAGSPYVIQGDITIPAGAYLHVNAGTVINFPGGDAEASGLSTTLVEINVNGSLVVSGTPTSPVTFHGVTATKGIWWGIVVNAGAAQAQISYANVNDAHTAVTSHAAGAILTTSHVGVGNADVGLLLEAGSPVIDSVDVHDSTEAIDIDGVSPAITITNSVIRSNLQGIAIVATGTPHTVVMSSTITGNTYGVIDGAPAGGLGLALTNDIITSNASWNIEAYAGEEVVTVTYSDVWPAGSTALPVVLGMGTISSNPQFVGAPGNLQVMPTSVTIDAGTATGAPPFDFVGAPRPVDGDGIGGAQFDMGAYEYGSAVVSLCGNGAIDAGETCDDGAANGTYGHCNATCSAPGPHCGDGIVNGPEACDDGNTSNTDACLNTCVAASCGDGYVRAGVEVCDDGNASNTDACLNTCVHASCGDGFVWSGVEACDDGNTSNADACLNTCVNASCGDGFVEAGVETCDEGALNGAYDHCSVTCAGVGAHCGDGTVNGPEACDDGNASNTDACLDTCVHASCGDGYVHVGVEGCDDGNASNTDGCLNTCLVASCGDGYVHAGVEQCDDGNSSNTDACLTTCFVATCGDGFVHAGVEDCDDGNMSNTDACLNSCVAASCGDGYVHAGVEQCDDGNTLNTDACLDTCVVATCGDGYLHVGVEQCDDGNVISGDGCSATCHHEAPIDAGPYDAGIDATVDANVVDANLDAVDASVADAHRPDATVIIPADAAATGDAAGPPAANGCGCRVGGVRERPVAPGWIILFLAGVAIRRSARAPRRRR